MVTDNNDKPTPAYILNHARLHTKGEILAALSALTQREREIWYSLVTKSATGDTGKNFAAIKAAIGG